ncbi:lactate utilization protein C [Amycolatopsis sp. La24]|uniref:LutC/YkgG family protein n=1 Tax=Amycolatopsis sp. La24 TaxID=3028304 RepID=UPI0023B0D148|nr:lactate utilization protein C [Amycolatopsis sp. La24]
MTARTQILERARRALSDVATRDPAADVPIDRPDQRRDLPREDLVDLFAEQVADYRAFVERTTEASVAGAIAQVLRSRSAQAGTGASRILVPPGFPAAYLPDGTGIVADGPGVPIVELDHCAGVVTTAAIGIAETGTIVLDHGPGQGRRAATLVPDLHVCLVRVEQVVAGLPEAVSALDPRRPQTWISGPSATSDIELDRVEGVHGPRTLHVLIISPDD